MTKRIIEFSPGYDKRNPDPKKNHGIHGLEIAFTVKGKEGAVQFLIYTNWMPRSCRKAWDELVEATILLPMAANRGYHSRVPRYEGQQVTSKDCKWTGGKCYYDGSSLNAEPLLDLLIEEGEEKVWAKLEKYYKKVFKDDN